MGLRRAIQRRATKGWKLNGSKTDGQIAFRDEARPTVPPPGRRVEDTAIRMSGDHLSRPIDQERGDHDLMPLVSK